MQGFRLRLRTRGRSSRSGLVGPIAWGNWQARAELELRTCGIMKTGSKDDAREEKRPSTRIAATAGSAANHLSKEEQHAMELGDESEHSAGKKREHLTKAAAKLGDKTKG